MITLHDLRKITDYEWEIPKTYRGDMLVPVRIFATRHLLETVLKDKSLEQAVNAATLPGLVGHVTVMPDMHQGYGFPIGGVAATRYPDGVISPGAIGYDINCLAGDSQVLHEHGYTRPIAEMAETDASLACFCFADSKLDAAPPALWFTQPPSCPVYRVTTAAGDELLATADHPLWTEDGMVPLERLEPGARVAIYPFRGVPFEPPSDQCVLTEPHVETYLRALGKNETGNALGQTMNQLCQRRLLPLSYDSPAVPYLCKILGFVFGDGNVRFVEKTLRGVVAFYGKPEDLEDIRRDVTRLGFKPSQIWSRVRNHQIQTSYNGYAFTHTESWFTVNSTAFAALLACLGAPVGKKTTQNYALPFWLETAPLWQKRLFLAALFGAEMSAPRAMTGHGTNFSPPQLSMNKREGFETSGQAFLEGMARWLRTFDVEAQVILPRKEQRNADGSQSIRFRLTVATNTENLLRFWRIVGFEYNRSRQALAAAAVQYLAHKLRHIEARQAAAECARTLADEGVAPQTIYTALAGHTVNRRFVERSLYEERRTPPRVGENFPTFEAFRRAATEGLGESGMVWEQIKTIELAPQPGLVYDFNMDHPDHNFVANGFVVSNCGVRLLASKIKYDDAEKYLDKLATTLNEYCPSGVGEKGSVPLSEKELDEVCREGSRWALRKGFATEMDLRHTEEGGRLDGADPAMVSKRAKDRGRPQLGTLGAGNHFIEVDIVDQIFDLEAAQVMGLEEGNLVVQIHCGSRGFGHQICTDYVDNFQKVIHKYGIKLPDRELVCAPMNSPEGQGYMAAMRAAANYAFANRQILADHIRRAFEDTLKGKVHNWHLHQVYDIAHNMGKVETHIIEGQPVQVCVHRKGATRAFGPGSPELPGEYQKIGQPVLVPGSMGTASWVLVGTEGSMAQSFGSTCHGAGRMMSRSKAKKEVRGDKLRNELEKEGIRIRAGSLAGLAEEAPAAYKDVDAVVATVSGAGIARKVARLVPVAVIKG